MGVDSIQHYEVFGGLLYQAAALRKTRNRNIKMKHSISNLWRCAKSCLAANASGSPQFAGRSLSFESLERRELLAAAGLVDVGAQPDGALSDKIVYTHGGMALRAISRTAAIGRFNDRCCST